MTIDIKPATGGATVTSAATARLRELIPSSRQAFVDDPAPAAIIQERSGRVTGCSVTTSNAPTRTGVTALLPWAGRAVARPDLTHLLAPPAPGQLVYNQVTTQDPGEILQAALSLPAGARAAIAGSLLGSLDTDVDEAADEEWRAEIRKRLAQLDGGRVTRVPWSEVRARLEQQARP